MVIQKENIKESYNRVSCKVSESDIEIYGKLLYLFKPLLKKEFRRLKSKKLSSGDSAIIMIHKILEIIFTEKSLSLTISIISLKYVGLMLLPTK